MVEAPSFTEQDVQSVVAEWGKVWRIIDRRDIARMAKWAMERIDRGDYGHDLLDEYGGAGEYLTHKANLFAHSPAARRPERYRVGARSFFLGSKGEPPRFLDDASEWYRGDKEDSTAEPMATLRTDAWLATAATWKVSIADRDAAGKLTPAFVQKAVEYLRRDGFTGTDDEARAALGVAL